MPAEGVTPTTYHAVTPPVTRGAVDGGGDVSRASLIGRDVTPSHPPRPTSEGVTRFVLTIESADTSRPVISRLRGLLKTTLRAWGFRCISVEGRP